MTTRQEVSQEIYFLESNKRSLPFGFGEAHNKSEMNTYRYENRPYDIPYRELKMVDEEKSTPWKTVPPSWKNSSSKGGRTANQIKKDRKRKKMNKRK